VDDDVLWNGREEDGNVKELEWQRWRQ